MLNKGDIVTFKSGSPKMVVLKINCYSGGAENAISCGWFDLKGRFQEHLFMEEYLIPETKTNEST